jgi:hypothetical protein
MSLYLGAKTAVKYKPDKSTDFIDLSVGVLQGDTLAPNLFVIVVDWVLRTSLDTHKALGVMIKRGSSRRYPHKYLTDLDFADDIALFAETNTNAQILLSSLETMALRVGLKINRSKTEYLTVGTFETPININVTTGPIIQVDDFKYLGSWLLDCSKDFKIRQALAWKAATCLVKIWKSKTISRKVKINLFLACVESTLLYNAVTWTMTDGLTKKLDGCYTRLLRFCLGYKWSDHVTNTVLYGNLPRVSKRLLDRKLRFAGHCLRATDQPISDILLWDHSNLTWSKCSKGAGARPNYAKRLLSECSTVVRSDIELGNLMRNREEWRKRIAFIVSENS